MNKDGDTSALIVELKEKRAEKKAKAYNDLCTTKNVSIITLVIIVMFLVGDAKNRVTRAKQNQLEKVLLRANYWHDNPSPLRGVNECERYLTKLVSKPGFTWDTPINHPAFPSHYTLFDISNSDITPFCTAVREFREGVTYTSN